jgi:hypothetical protein
LADHATTSPKHHQGALISMQVADALVELIELDFAHSGA